MEESWLTQSPDAPRSSRADSPTARRSLPWTVAASSALVTPVGVSALQVDPFVLVRTTPLRPTTRKRFSPWVTRRRSVLRPETRRVQVEPSALLATKPPSPTATNVPFPTATPLSHSVNPASTRVHPRPSALR